MKKIWGLCLVIAAVYLLFIWQIPIIDGDSFYYIAKAQSLLNGDSLTLGAKPPLAVWLIALSCRLFGNNLFAVNFWHALFSLGTIALTYLLALRFFSRRAALLSSVVLSSTLLMFYQNRTPMLDTPLTFFCLATIFWLMLFEEQAKLSTLLAAFFCAGLGFLTKGLLGLALPFGAYFFYLLFISELFSRLRRHLPKFALGLVIFLLTISIWLIPQTLAHGTDFTQELFRENIERFFHTIDASGNNLVHQEGTVQRDHYIYVIYLAIFFLPWSAFIPRALLKDSARAGILRSACLLIFLLFSLSGHYKNPRYILPLFPPLAVLVGIYFADRPSIGKGVRVFYLICALLLVTATVFVGFTHLPAATAGYRPLAMVLLGGLTLVCLVATVSKPETFFTHTATAMFAALLINVLALALTLPKVDQAYLISQTARRFPDRQIIALERNLYDLQFYLNRPVQNVDTVPIPLPDKCLLISPRPLPGQFKLLATEPAYFYGN